jgi:hypothetical protein
VILHQSNTVSYRRVKWQITSTFIYKLRYSYGLTEDFHHPKGWYSVVKGEDGAWYLIAHVGCAWDGATLYFDYLWMMVPSLVHDILHWLIKRGVIHEIYNDVIDLELEQAIIHGKEPIPWRQGGNSKIVRRLRAKIILRGTNLADEKTLTGDFNDIKIERVLV